MERLCGAFEAAGKSKRLFISGTGGQKHALRCFKEFSEHTGIPVRTLEDWEAARRTPPEYIPRLIDYQLKYEKLMQEKEVKNAEE